MKPSKEYQDFRLAIRGWAFCSNAMLKGRIEAGEKKVGALQGQEREDAENTLNSMRGALEGIPL